MNLFEDLGSRVVYSIQLKQHSSYAAACPQINGPTPLLVEGRVRGRRRRLKAVRWRELVHLPLCCSARLSRFLLFAGTDQTRRFACVKVQRTVLARVVR